MKIITDSGGVNVYVLPECGVCIITHKSPIDMWECPLRKFDGIGDECRPDACEHYTEE